MWYYKCNKVNTELQAKVNRLQETVNRLSADGHTAENRPKTAAAFLQACERRRAAQALLWQLFDAMQCGAQQQPHSCRCGSTNKQQSFCCNIYVLTRHDLQWWRPESRRFSVAEPHEPD